MTANILYSTIKRNQKSNIYFIISTMFPTYDALMSQLRRALFL